MEISEVNNFIELLSQACEQKKYISKNDLKIKVIQEKNNKNINTAAIVQIAEECLTSLPKATSLIEKNLMSTKMQQVLSSYSLRLHQSQPWWRKILGYFYTSQEEKKLEFIKQKLKDQNHEEYERLAKNINKETIEIKEQVVGLNKEYEPQKPKNLIITCERQIQNIDEILSLKCEIDNEQKLQEIKTSCQEKIKTLKLLKMMKNLNNKNKEVNVQIEHLKKEYDPQEVQNAIIKCEKQIQNIDKILKQMAKDDEQEIQKLQGSKKNLRDMTEILKDLYIEKEIKGFYNRVVGSRYKNVLLDGEAGFISNCAFYKDIKSFEQFYIEQKRSVPKELIEAKEELHFSIQVINGTITVQEILQSITSLSYGSKSVIIPGGCFDDDRNEGHGVIYKIDKEINGTYSFTVINSGVGGELGLNPNFFKSNHKKKDDLIQNYDLIYTGISADKFTEEFINQLRDEHKLKTMDNANHVIKNQFAGVTQVRGRSHKPQKKGNCGFKCNSFYLSQKLGPLLYQEFKVFFTVLENKKLISLRRSDILKDTIVNSKGGIISTKEVIDTLIFQGQLTLNRRMKKLEALRAIKAPM